MKAEIEKALREAYDLLHKAEIAVSDRNHVVALVESAIAALVHVVERQPVKAEKAEKPAKGKE